MNDNNKQNFKNFSSINDVIKKYSIIDILKNYVNLQKKGQNFWCLCPFHGDKNPSLSVSPQKNIFKCFVCNAKGNAISFVMQLKKISYIEAVKEIVSTLNIEDENLNNLINSSYSYNKEFDEIYKLNKDAAFVYHRTLFNKEGKQCLDYLKNRMIDENLIDFYQIGYAIKNQKRDYLFKLLTEKNNEENGNRPSLLFKAGLTFLNDNNEYIDFFSDRLIIPIKNENGNIVGFSGRSLNNNEKIKYLNTRTTEVFKKENILFNFYSFDKSEYKEIYVVEGYMDVFAFKRLGINNVVASMGTSFTDYQIKLIKKYKNINTIVICFDNDSAGQEATKSLTKKLMQNNFNVFVVSPYDSKYKDIDELSRSLNKEECLNVLNNQISFVQYEIECLKKYDLSYKDKKIETQKIVDTINEFAYNPFFISDDLKKLEEFSGINASNLENLIIKKNNRRVEKNKKNASYKLNSRNFASEIFSDYIKNELEENNKKSAYEKVFVDDQNNLKASLKEKELIPLLIFDKDLIKYFQQYLGFIQFNKNCYLEGTLKTILFYCQQHMDDEEFNSGLVIQDIFKNSNLNNLEKTYTWNFVENFFKKNKYVIANKNKILIQGLLLIKDIKEHILNMRIMDENDIDSNFKREQLKNEKRIMTKEINDLIENLIKK